MGVSSVANLGPTLEIHAFILLINICRSQMCSALCFRRGLQRFCRELPPEGFQRSIPELGRRLGGEECVPVRLCQLDISWSHLKTSAEKMSLSDWLGQVFGAFAFIYLIFKLMFDVGGPSHCEWCHPWTGSPGLYKKAGWESMETKPVSRVPPRSLLQFLPSGSSLTFLCDGP